MSDDYIEIEITPDLSAWDRGRVPTVADAERVGDALRSIGVTSEQVAENIRKLKEWADRYRLSEEGQATIRGLFDRGGNDE